MGYIKVGEENTTPIELYYEDHGSGRPVVLIHGWPLNGASWEKQMIALLKAGYRVITYDRRGFGKSSHPASGYEYDTFASDLDVLLRTLDLRDATLAGFSMGTGEVARYVGTYGSDRVRSVAYLGGILPFLIKTDDNPTGLPAETFTPLVKAATLDRFNFLAGFLQNFYNADQFVPNRISDEAIRHSWNVGASSSAIGLVQCMVAWGTDFRTDLAKLDRPALIVHGDADRIVPIHVTGNPLHALLPSAKMITLEGAPHGFLWTHAEDVNAALVEFLGR